MAIIAAIGLLAGAFLIGSRVGRQDEAASVTPSTSTTSAPQSTAPPSSTPSSPPTTQQSPTTTPRSGSSSSVDESEVRAEVAELKRYVEKARGLTFKNEVEVTVLSSADFKARVLQEFDKETDELRKQGQYLQALGLVPAGQDPVEVQKNLLGEGVLGFYDPITKALVVKGDKIGPFFREIVVHELTHALDDQHFNLHRPEIEERTDGSEWSWLALVEGDARRIEYDYVRQLPSDEKQRLIEEMLSSGGESALDPMGGAPLALILIIQSPYDYGEPFVRDVFNRHGQAGVDKAFNEPPTTSEQILQPDKYESREGALGIDAPSVEGEKMSEGSMGEIMTGFLVNGELSMEDLFSKILGGLDPDDPTGGLGSLFGGDVDDPTKLNDIGALVGKADKVKNWGDDKYVLYRTASQMCIKVDWVMDSPADTQNLRKQLNTWAQEDGVGKVDSMGDKTRMTRCIAAQPSGSSGSGNPGRNS